MKAAPDTHSSGAAPALSRAELARLLDHSVLKPESTSRDIEAGAALVREWRIGFYCVQLAWIGTAARLLAGTDANVIAVVGFPHGCEPASIKVREAELAIAEGAGEIDMVINFGRLRSGDTGAVGAEIAAVVRAAAGKPVKAIIEATVLTTDEKRAACRLVVDNGAAFVKTSTGFHPTGGATIEDIRLLRATVGPHVGVKASGGIRTLA